MTDEPWLTVTKSYLGKRKTFDRFMRAQNHLCYLCGKELPTSWSHNTPQSVTRDHVYPKGPRPFLVFDHSNNILYAHRCCNMKKGCREPYACEVLFLKTTLMRLLHPEGGQLVPTPQCVSDEDECIEASVG